MKSLRILSVALALGCVSSLLLAASDHEGHDMAGSAGNTGGGKLVPITEKDSAWLAKAKAEYPTTTCIVSDDKLGEDMGKPADFIYREAGKPDRLISFCCKDCVKDFNKEPQKYLKMLDDAAAAKKGEASGKQPN